MSKTEKGDVSGGFCLYFTCYCLNLWLCACITFRIMKSIRSDYIPTHSLKVAGSLSTYTKKFSILLTAVCSYSLSKPQSDRVAFPHISSILYNSFQLWLMWPKLGINVHVDLHVLEGWLGRISGGCNDKPCISVMCFHPGLWIASKPITEKHRWCRWNPAVTGDKSKCDIIWFLFTFCGQLHPYTKVLTECFIKAK